MQIRKINKVPLERHLPKLTRPAYLSPGQGHNTLFEHLQESALRHLAEADEKILSINKVHFTAKCMSEKFELFCNFGTNLHDCFLGPS